MGTKYGSQVIGSALLLSAIIGTAWWVGSRHELSTPAEDLVSSFPEAREATPDVVRAAAPRPVRREPATESERRGLESTLHSSIVRAVEEYDVPMLGCDVACADESCAADLIFRTGEDAQLIGRIPLDRRLDAEFVESVDQTDGSVIVKVRFRADRVLATQR